MSDLTDLLAGKFGSNPVQAVEAFAEKEYTNFANLVAKAPADLQPAIQNVIADGKTVISDAVEWAGTAASAYISANGGNLQTEVANLITGALGGASPLSVAGADTIQAITALLLGIVSHTVLSTVNVASPVAA